MYRTDKQIHRHTDTGIYYIDFHFIYRPIVVAQVKPPVANEPLQSLNQIPRQGKTNKNRNLSSKSENRRGKAFQQRSRSGRNRIFPPPPNIPETNFSCTNYEFPGLYADTETNCEVSHQCTLGVQRARDFRASGFAEFQLSGFGPGRAFLRSKIGPPAF